MLFDIQSAVPFIAVATGLGAILLRVRSGWPAARLFFFLLFIAYLTVVSSYAFFPIRTDDSFIEVMRRRPNWLGDINLVPLANS